MSTQSWRRYSMPLVGFAVLALAGCGLFDGGDPSVTTWPPADAPPDRWVVLEGANNTRDIGGYLNQDGRRVRLGRVYRSGQLSDLTPTGCGAFESLNIRTVVDFRNRLSPSPLFDGDPLCVHAVARVLVLPVSAEDTDLDVPTYVQRVRVSAASFRRTFELLADEDNLPLLYHCAAGKDRTGIMTALLLALLGVDRETVMVDYGLSDLVDATTKPQAMADLLDEVESQGGIETYLADIGVTPETQAAIRAALLEEAEPAPGM